MEEDGRRFSLQRGDFLAINFPGCNKSKTMNETFEKQRLYVEQRPRTPQLSHLENKLFFDEHPKQNTTSGWDVKQTCSIGQNKLGHPRML